MFIKPPHKQEIFFSNGTKRAIEDVVKVEQGNWYHIQTKEGVEYITNPAFILFVRVTKQKK